MSRGPNPLIPGFHPDPSIAPETHPFAEMTGPITVTATAAGCTPVTVHLEDR